MLIKYSRSPSEQIRQECEPKCGLQRPHSSHDTTMLPQICLPRTHSPLSPMKVSRFHQGRPRTARALARRAVPAWVTVKDATMLRDLVDILNLHLIASPMLQWKLRLREIRKLPGLHSLCAVEPGFECLAPEYQKCQKEIPAIYIFSISET